MTIEDYRADLPYPILVDELEAYRAAAGVDNLIAARLLEARRAYALEVEEATRDAVTIATSTPDALGWE